MSLTFNGTTSKLVLNGAIGATGITAYPFTVFCWIKVTSPDQNGFPFSLQVKAADASNATVQTVGGLYVATSDMVASWRAGDYTYPAGGTISTGVWVPLMISFTSSSSTTIRLGSLTAVTGTTAITFDGNKISVLGVGVRELGLDNFFKGDIACLAMWSSTLGGTEFSALSGDVVPSTVSPGTLIEYWSLLSTAATQTGVNGRVLTATSTTTGANHPITESAPPSVLGGNVDADAAVAAGQLGSSATDLSGGVTLDAAVGAGSLGVQPAGWSVPALTNWSGTVQAGVTVPLVSICRLADGVQVAVLTNQLTDGSGNLSGTSASLVPGTWYMFTGWNADGSARFARPVQAT